MPQQDDPAIALFDCPRHIALRINPSSCARSWTAARRLPKDSLATLAKCRGCAIGAANAGQSHEITLVQFRVCSRCGAPSSKLVLVSQICPSCHNREREVIRGRNARGTWPAKARALHFFFARAKMLFLPDPVICIPRVAHGEEAGVAVSNSIKGVPTYSFAFPSRDFVPFELHRGWPDDRVARL